MAKDEQAEVRDIAILASDAEVNALAELIDLAVKNKEGGGYKVARNAGFWVQKLEEAVAVRNAEKTTNAKPDLRAVPKDTDHGAA